MTFHILTKKQMNEKKLSKPLEDFFKNPNGTPVCFGFFGKYQNLRPCSNCNFKKKCYEKYINEG